MKLEFPALDGLLDQLTEALESQWLIAGVICLWLILHYLPGIIRAASEARRLGKENDLALKQRQDRYDREITAKLEKLERRRGRK
ncbi:MAG: hypothetical protein AAGF46_13330 [Pseudomonadota bacterium]